MKPEERAEETKNGSGKVRPRAAILGAGRMARAVAKILGASGAEVRLWARKPSEADALAHELGALATCATPAEALDGAGVVFLAVPGPAMLDVAELYGPHARGDHVVLHASRGVGPGFALPHQMIRAKTCVRKIGVLGGPLHARELATGRPFAAVIASRFGEVISLVQALTRGTPVMVHGSRDVVGVEVAGALSNVGALAAGMAEALDLGDTARGVLLTHGLAESKTLGVALGADPVTFSGLAGVGDLIPRKVSSTDRHRVVGAAVATGTPLATALAQAGGHVEGVDTAREAVLLAAKLGLELPLVSAVHDILEGRVPPKETLERVLRRDLDLDFVPPGGTPRA
ncbi:NAD(P)-binding domain-containing protein [Myxococcota bacterium]|nr:NAD(P)-binding domain-containing protein [Myxococcota bacterium]